MNIAYQDVARLIWESASGWQYDDSNATTLPIAKGSLVHNQQDYSLPSTAQRVHRIEVKDNGGTWHQLNPIDEHTLTNQALPEYLAGTGLPLYYDLVGRSVMFYPRPSSAYCTLASGMALYVDRDVVEFAVTADSSTPGFATSFHPILAYAAAIDFVRSDTEKARLVSQRDRLEKGMIRFYAKRNVELPTKISPHSRRVQRQYQ